MAATTTTTTSTTASASSSSCPLQSMTDEELQRVFKQFDTNGDGKISASELSQVLSALGSTTSSADLTSAMEEMDTDKDGFISLAEFSAICRSNSSAESDLRDAFDLYDQDKNGLISACELHLVLNKLNMKCSVEDCERMIKSVDKDGDGSVDYKEFKKMMMSGDVASKSKA